MDTKRILIVLSSDIYIRNYITTDALDVVEQHYECHYLVSDKVKAKGALGQKKHVHEYQVDAELHKQHFKSFNVIMWRFRRLSTAFEFRFRRKFDIPVKWKEVNSVASFTIYSLKWLVRRFRVLRIQIIASKFFFPVYRKLVINKIELNTSLSMVINRISPDLIIYTSSAYDPEGIDIIKIGKHKQIKTLFLIDNWDNLSSKTVMLERPDFITVWGQQNVAHAIDIHGFARNEVFMVGTPRFNEYFKQRNLTLPSHFTKRYVLFLGCAIPFDEASALEVLDQEIEQNKNVYKDLVVVYRPHPWRQGNDSILNKGLSNIIIDPQVEGNYRNKKGVAFQPSLDYYPSLLSNADFVTGPLTSMLIESLIFYKRVLALVYDDGENITSPNNALKYYPHFKGLENIEGLSLASKIDSLGLDFRKVWTDKQIVDKAKLDGQRRFYLFDNEDEYKVRLIKVINDVLSVSSSYVPNLGEQKVV